MQETNKPEPDLMRLAANAVRCLAMDAIEKANSGHPGMPLGCADMAVVLWLKFLKHNPQDPAWADRDRFILSPGHGSMLLYSLLHLSGYDRETSQIQQFRQWDSLTPGHPEFRHTPGVETTTGPLGQGFANGVGMALTERHLAAVFNEPQLPLVDHFTYAIVSDGDLMEGVAAEAASFAGHHGLGKLIYLYDSNRITIEGSTDLTFSRENVRKRFDSYDWHTLEIDGHDMKAVEEAIIESQKETDRPSLIVAHTHIALGSPNKQDSAASHGSPLGAEEVRLTKQNLGFPSDKAFYIPREVYDLFSQRRDQLKQEYAKWQNMMDEFVKSRKDKAELWARFHTMPDAATLDGVQVVFDPAKPLATRAASGNALQTLAPAVPQIVGGSADLAPSNNTFLKQFGAIRAGDFSGRNIHFGIREHAMGAIMNGMAIHGGVIPFGGTFLVFADYMRPSIRLAAMMKLPVVYVFTHDSFYVGEDGPTHQPIEHITSLRLIPGLTVIRPADPTETVEAWRVALRRQGPVALILTRQNLPVIDRSQYPAEKNLARGAYVMAGAEETTDCVILAGGSEVSISLKAREMLLKKGIKARVVSFPSWELFEEQPESWKNSVIPPDAPLVVAIEAGRAMGWEKYTGKTGAIISIEHFGASAPGDVLAEKFGMTAENIVEKVEQLLR